MNIHLIVVGKTDAGFVETGVEMYTKRVSRYNRFELTVIPDIKNAKNLSVEQLKQQEGEAILKLLQKMDYTVLLDEKGKTFSSSGFAEWIDRLNFQSYRNVCFVIGGAYGFSKEVYAKADATLSLSEMTFSHQMVRLFFTEQLYRAFTILAGEPYHHE